MNYAAKILIFYLYSVIRDDFNMVCAHVLRCRVVHRRQRVCRVVGSGGFYHEVDYLLAVVEIIAGGMVEQSRTLSAGVAAAVVPVYRRHSVFAGGFANIFEVIFAEFLGAVAAAVYTSGLADIYGDAFADKSVSEFTESVFYCVFIAVCGFFPCGSCVSPFAEFVLK